MTALTDLLSLRRMGGQIAALLLVALAIGQVTTIWIYEISGPANRTYHMTRYDARALASVSRMLANSVTPDQEAAAMDLITRTFPTLQLQPTELTGHPPAPGSYWRRTVEPELGEGFSVRLVAETFSAMDPLTEIIVVLPDGRKFQAIIHRGANVLFRPNTSIVLAIFAVIGIAFCLAWVGRSVSRPLADLALLASRFDPDRLDPPLVPERGPQELRMLARTFNAMLQRISLLIRNRTMTLTAIAHDLRTPITRMRLRAETVEDEAVKAALIRDLDVISLVVSGALRLTGPAAEAARHEATDLAVLLETICDDFHENGGCVSYIGPQHLIVVGVSEDLWRLFTNLVLNGTKYGERVIVQLRTNGGQAVVTVEDDGPGIPPQDRDAMLQPFIRADSSRSSEGMGLGLAIANAIAQNHDGRLRLMTGSLGGLAAEVELPLPRGPDENPMPDRDASESPMSALEHRS